jgi:cellulose synthase/poly-beta-1,6-N-acetylglucosamine synthase-like glycosyltransferase
METILIFGSLIALFYIWVGYPLALWLLWRMFRRLPLRSGGPACPKVSIVVPVRNEEAGIAAKIRDCQAFQYPPESLEIVIISDSSTDRTEAIVQELAASDARIRLLRAQNGRGKSNAQNQAAREASGEFLLFTDAGTRIPAPTLPLLLENFANPKIGLVTADVALGDPENAVAEGQGAYWRFELFLRKLESELGILATASGQLLLLRAAQFRPLPVMYGDDCVMPLDVRLQGYRVIQDARTVVFDTMPHTIHGELKTRIRMTARNWGGTWNRPAILNPFRFPLTFWSLVSHKLLRWLTPLFMTIVLLANVVAVARGHYFMLLAAQAVFYVSAFLGWLRARQGEAAWAFTNYAFAFCLANLGFVLGLFKLLRKEKIIAY